MARYGHGGKQWIRYNTAQNIIHDTIRCGPKTLHRILLHTQVDLRSTVRD